MSESDADRERRRKILDELVEEAQRLGLYDIEIEPCSCGRMPPCRHLSDEGHPH